KTALDRRNDRLIRGAGKRGLNCTSARRNRQLMLGGEPARKLNQNAGCEKKHRRHRSPLQNPTDTARCRLRWSCFFVSGNLRRGEIIDWNNGRFVGQQFVDTVKFGHSERLWTVEMREQVV